METKKEFRMCPTCCRGQEHIIEVQETVMGRYTFQQELATCTVCKTKVTTDKGQATVR